MATTLFELMGVVGLDGQEETEKGLNTIDGKAKDTDKSFSNMAKNIGKGALAVTGAITAGAGAMFGMATKSAEATDRIDKMSQKLGLSRQGFQELDFITSQSGTSIDNMASGMKTLSTRMQEALEGTGIGAQAFEQLGVSVTDSNGELKSQEQILKESIIAFQGMEQGATKSALASDLFSRSGQELLPLLNAQQGSLEAMTQQANELGLVMSDEAVNAGVAFTDTMDQLQRSFGTALSTIGVEFMPMIQGMASWIIDNMPTIRKVVKVAFDIISGVVTFASNTIGAFITVVSDWLMPIIDDFKGNVDSNLPAIKSTFDTVFSFLQEVTENLHKFYEESMLPIITAFKEIVDENMPTIKEIIRIAFDTITTILNAFWTLINATIIPIITTLFNAFNENLPAIKETVRIAFDTIKTILEGFETLINLTIKPLVDGLKNAFETAFPLIKTAVKTTFDFITSTAGAVVEAISGVVEWVGKAIEALNNFASTKERTGGIGSTSSGGSGGFGVTSTGFRDFIENPLPTSDELPSGIGGTGRASRSSRGSVNVTQNFYTPKTPTPSEVSRKTRQGLQEMALKGAY